MSRVTYQAMLGPGDGDRSPYAPLEPATLRSKRRDALVSFKARFSPRHRRWLDETATARGVTTDQVVMVALDLMIALDLDWQQISKAGDLREAVAGAVGVRRPGSRSED